MWIESIAIRGFGRLAERRYEFPRGRAALVIEDNEAGKSTLAAAIVAGLCGFPSRRQSGETMKASEVYKPWDGGDYGIEMTVEAGGKRYTIERDFSRDSFTIRNAATNADVSANFDPDLAQSFFGLSRDDFRRLALVSGKDVQQFSSSTDIRARLAAAVEGSGGEIGADVAIAALESARYTLEGRSLKVESALSRIRDAESLVSRRIAELDVLLDSAGEEARRLEQSRAAHADLERKLSDLDNELKAARLVEVRQQIETAERNAEAAEALREELAELERYAAFPAERGEQLSRAATRLAERQSQLAELADRSRRLEQQAGEIRAKLASQERFAEAGDDDLLQLGACESELASAQSMASGKREEVGREKRALSAEGIDLNRAQQANERLKSLSPGDREFVRSHPETEARLTAEEVSANAAVSNAESGLASIRQRRASAGVTGRALLAAGLLLGVAGVVLMIAGVLAPALSVMPVAGGVVIGAAGAVGLARASGLQADEKARLEREIEDAQSRSKQAREQLGRDGQRLQEIASRIGVTDTGALVESLRECERALRRSEPLQTLLAQLAQTEEGLESVRSRARRLLARLGSHCDDADAIPDVLLETRLALSGCLESRRMLREIESDLASIARETAERQSSASDERTAIAAVLTEAGIDPSLPIDTAMDRFGEARSRCERYRQLRDTLLPAAQRHVLPDGELARLRGEESALAVDQPDVDPGRASLEVERERDAVRREADTLLQEVRRMEREVGARVDEYRREYPDLQEELRQIGRERSKAERFASAIATAAEVLREVSEESHRRWAAALNARASGILNRLNPAYEDIRFDESLDFTLRCADTGRIVKRSEVDARLSTGAKDQVYLAVRLACCEELSRAGEALPLLLDDPLIAADDSRFRRGLEYLVTEVAKQAQVIVLSCHASRHERLRGEQWFGENVEVIGL